MITPLSTQEFIAKAKHRYGNKFTFEKTEYVNMRSMVVVTCDIHGDIEVNPQSFLNKSKTGCRKCGFKAISESKNKYSKSEIIEEFKNIHGDEFDYSDADYKSMSDKIKITHKKCGRLFTQLPSSHLKYGCMACSAKERGAEVVKKSKHYFVSLARSIHGDKYDYDLSGFSKMNSKIDVFCRVHKIHFYPTAANHTHSKNPTGCPMCGAQKCHDSLRKGRDKFVNDAILVHGNHYSYEDVEYKNNRDKVKIVCPHHGPFYQAPWSHISGNGCKSCSGSRMERLINLLLMDMGVNFAREFSFQDCRAVAPLRFDFAIFNEEHGEPVGLIEYHGEQHFRPVEHFGGKAEYEQRVIRDKIKEDYCSKNNLPLLVLSSENDKEIDIFISRFITKIAK